MAIGKKGSLLPSSLLEHDSSDDDPRIGLVNLADVMLVFACGLMIALVARYSIDLGSTGLEGAEPLEGTLEEVGISSSDIATTYVEVGTVYEDTSTGELYVVEQ